MKIEKIMDDRRICWNLDKFENIIFSGSSRGILWVSPRMNTITIEDDCTVKRENGGHFVIQRV